MISQCGFRSDVALIDGVDPDLVIINIEEGGREFIGNVLMTIDSCAPKVVIIDSWFIDEQHSENDSILLDALRLIDNDILGYGFDFDTKTVGRSHGKFRALVAHEGHTLLHNIGNFSSSFVPEMVVDSIS